MLYSGAATYRPDDFQQLPLFPLFPRKARSEQGDSRRGMGSEARGDLGMLIGSVKVSGRKTSEGGTKKRRGESDFVGDGTGR